MRSALGLLADTDIAQDILNGTWEPPDEVDVYTKLLLQIIHPQLNSQSHLALLASWIHSSYSLAFHE